MIGAALLLIYGMLQPVEQDSRWILSLWLAAPLLLLTIRFSLPKAPHGVARSIQNLAIVVAVGFSLLSFELLRQQFVRSHEIYNFIYTDDQTGQSTSNVRPIIDAERVQRGKIVDSTGRVLASSRVTNGFATRTYPIEQEFDPTSFGNVLGYFSSRFGQSGLELTYSDYLSGEHDAWSRWQDWMLGNPRVGSDLHLTLSAPLQAAAGQILAGRTGSIVVLNPKTGAVLAMASGPNFDPRGLATNNDAEDSAADNSRVGAYWNEITSDASGQPLINRPVQGRYPPGSTYKTVTAIGALENPQLGRPDEIDCPNERYTDEGAPPVVNAVNDLFTRTGNPSNLEHVYAFSCNTAFAEYAMRLGQEKEVEIAERFDIYRPQDTPDSYSGFTDLPTRASQIYVDPGFLNTKAAVADTGYGQGQLLVTPLQMAMVAASVANDGVMMRPYLVDHITRPDGATIYTHGPSAIRRVMSSETAAKMRVNMRAGVEYGFGKAAQQVDPSVALVGGKSGTAENVPGATPHAWFIAIAPVDNPRYAVAVMIENGGEGSSVGARAAGEVLAAAFSLEQ
ncbi:penicillin-binding protein 2 [Chloroflexia bacterium SDU3-3]|nr:penicillin-binding protein 2 [Chloroflexia bacterium SDU3-3]